MMTNNTPMLICDICGQSVWRNFSNQLVCCAICGLVRAKVNPTREELAKAYERSYFFGEEYFDYFQDRPALEKNFRARLDRLRSYINQTSVVLEIGCSYGFFLNLCKEIAGKLIGYDITQDGIAYAKNDLGLNVYCDDFLNYNGEQLDMVCLWDVMEHVPNPDQIIKHVARYMKKGGHIALTTGDVGSFIARIRKDKWRMVHPPTHLFYFDKQSIEKLLCKYGFKLVSFRHTAVYRNVDSVFNQLIAKQKKSGKNTKILNFLHILAKRTGIYKLNFGLNLYDIMEVIAEKES